MSTPTKAAEIIRQSIETAMARIGCPPGDNADADIYHDLQHALSLLADMEGEGEHMNTQAIIDAAVECFDLGPEDADNVLRFMCRVEGMQPHPSVEDVMAIVGPLCLGEATERHITDRLTKLFTKP